MIESLKTYFPNFSYLQESYLGSEPLDGFWQVTALEKNGEPLGSGFAKNLSAARKIAVAEFIERQFVLDLRNSSEAEKWRLDHHPTACGFAVGFDPLNTQIRSIAEALERWALSKWMDDGCYLEKERREVCSHEGVKVLGEFDDCFVFKKEFFVNIGKICTSFHLCVLAATRGNGSFMGSAVRTNFSDALTHSLMEAYRHYIISKQDRNFNIFPYNRILYFARNIGVAMGKIHSKKNNEWPHPILDFQRSYRNELFCVSRTIFKDWMPWERGPIDRMLY